MSRVFMIVGSPCFGQTGGGHGIEYRIFESNRKYCLLDEVYFVFSDRVIEPGMECGELAIRNNKKERGKIFMILKKLKPQFLRTYSLNKEYKNLSNFISKIGEKYRFSNNDIYIFQDVKTAYVFSKCFPFKKSALVFHMQGSMYYEWSASLGVQSKAVHKFFNLVFGEAVSNMRYLCFPSIGTEGSLIETEPCVENLIRSKERKYLYNGISCPDINYSEINTWIKDVREKTTFVFSTVAVLNTAKAVERIPSYLGKLKKAGLDFKWILIGNGVKADEVHKQIEENDLISNTIWKRDFVKHDEVLEVLSISDLYILFHKQSIFDLSTLEAMHYGAIPILTPVGGNKEVIIENNGVFVDDFTNIDDLIDLINNKSIEATKKRNIDIQNRLFDDIAMLQRYVKLVEELEEKD